MRKVPVGVMVQFDTTGAAHPLSVTWEDGRIYLIEAVKDMRSGRNAPGRFRYTVSIHTQDAYLYRDGDRWYMESVR